MGKLDVNLSKSQIDRVFDQFDQDGNGKLNYQEFSRFNSGAEDARNNDIDPLTYGIIFFVLLN